VFWMSRDGELRNRPRHSRRRWAIGVNPLEGADPSVRPWGRTWFGRREAARPSRIRVRPPSLGHSPALVESESRHYKIGRFAGKTPKN
jgi:hypothetical protein